MYNSSESILELIWKAHDIMCKNKKQSERKSAVLGLVFLKYISDKFEYKYKELLSDGLGDEEDKNKYLDSNIFWVPKEARWSEITNKMNNPRIGYILDEVIEILERENQQLQNLINKVFSTTSFNKGELCKMIFIVNDINLNRV